MNMIILNVIMMVVDDVMVVVKFNTKHSQIYGKENQVHVPIYVQALEDSLHKLSGKRIFIFKTYDRKVTEEYTFDSLYNDINRICC